MKRLRFEIKCAIVWIKNLCLFVELATKAGTPFHLWPRAWREIEADHRARVRSLVFQARMEGRIRQDADGRLWPVKDE